MMWHLERESMEQVYVGGGYEEWMWSYFIVYMYGIFKNMGKTQIDGYKKWSEKKKAIFGIM